MKPIDTIPDFSLPALPSRAAVPAVPGTVAPRVDEEPATEFQEATIPSDQELEQLRMQQAEKAARVIADYFIVSDVRFTIFKDASGQYVTRFTSLQDGTVHYIPEPNMVKLYAQLTGQDPNLLQLKV